MTVTLLEQGKEIGLLVHKADNPGVILHVRELPVIWADCFSLEEALRLLQLTHPKAEFKFNPPTP